MAVDIERRDPLRPRETGAAEDGKLKEPFDEVLKVWRAVRAVEIVRLLAGLPPVTFKVIALCGSGLVRDTEPEFVPRELDQLVDESLAKFARFAASVSTNSRNQVMVGSA